MAASAEGKTGSIWQLTSGPGSVTTNAWHHVAATYYNGDMELYVDGVRVNDYSFGGSAVPFVRVAAFTIGGRNDPAGARAQGAPTGDFGYGYFHGLLDELRVWSQVRNPGQIMIDMLDTPCGFKDENGFLQAARDIDGVCLQLDPALLAYWAFDETPFFQNSTNNLLVRNRAAEEHGAKYLVGPITWSAQAVNESSSTSYMDRTVTTLVAVEGGATLQQLGGGSSRITWSPGTAGDLIITIVDPNPSDSVAIADLPFFPATGGIPTEAVFGDAEPGQPAYCDGAPGCSAEKMIGKSVSRRLSWTPQLHSDWVVPPGGFPVSIEVDNTPTNPSNLALSAPAVQYSYGPIYLDVQLPPEFVAPTPDPTDPRPYNITTLIGEEVKLEIKAVHRNQLQRADIVVAEDPGLPNAALLTSATETTATRREPFSTTREFVWTPRCPQSGFARVRLEAIAREVTTLRSSKSFFIHVVRPQPRILDIDSSARTLRVGCPLNLPVVAYDANLLPASSSDTNGDPAASTPAPVAPNPNYKQTFEWKLFRSVIAVAPDPSSPPPIHDGQDSLEELPADFPGVQVEPAFGNDLNGMTSKFSWVPHRGQEGRSYRVCVTVLDQCEAGTPVHQCVDLNVLKCQTCLGPSESLQSIASEYRTDFLSLYVTNVQLASPDRNPPATPINTGVMYKVKEGDTMAKLAARFFTTVEALLEVNTDIAERSGIRTPFSRAGHVNLPPRRLWPDDVLRSDNLPHDLSIWLTPGDQVHEFLYNFPLCRSPVSNKTGAKLTSCMRRGSCAWCLQFATLIAMKAVCARSQAQAVQAAGFWHSAPSLVFDF